MPGMIPSQVDHMHGESEGLRHPDTCLSSVSPSTHTWMEYLYWANYQGVQLCS